MNALKFSLVAVVAMGLTGLAEPADAAPLRTSFAACEAAIAAELGDGRLRNALLKAHQNDGSGRHWINVRFRSDSSSATARYRVLCETERSGDVSELALDEGRWRATRPNRAPLAVD